MDDAAKIWLLKVIVPIVRRLRRDLEDLLILLLKLTNFVLTFHKVTFVYEAIVIQTATTNNSRTSAGQALDIA